jgi:hypothetical protein
VVAVPFEQTVIKIGYGTHQKVTDIKTVMEGEKHRQVTYSEVIDVLADAYARWLALAADTEAS